MNRQCMGDFFTVKGESFYRCLADGFILRIPTSSQVCPHCTRLIKAAKDHKEVPTRLATQAIIDGAHIDLPDPPKPKRKLCSICGCTGIIELPTGCICEGALWIRRTEAPTPICDKFSPKRIGGSLVFVLHNTVCGTCDHRKGCHNDTR